jgi:hypothetical protein
MNDIMDGGSRMASARALSETGSGKPAQDFMAMFSSHYRDRKIPRLKPAGILALA